VESVSPHPEKLKKKKATVREELERMFLEVVVFEHPQGETNEDHEINQEMLTAAKN
jgi:hypothetical protein